MWKFYFAVDKNMRARRLIKKEARASVIGVIIYYSLLVPAAAQIACVILRAASQYISANWLFIYFVRGCEPSCFLSTRPALMQSRKYE
jgi:hypothetical protein